jgi:hypothetical protein
LLGAAGKVIGLLLGVLEAVLITGIAAIVIGTVVEAIASRRNGP